MTATLKAVTDRALSQVGGYYPGNSPYGVWYDSTYHEDRGAYDAAAFCAMGLSWVFAPPKALPRLIWRWWWRTVYPRWRCSAMRRPC